MDSVTRGIRERKHFVTGIDQQHGWRRGARGMCGSTTKVLLHRWGEVWERAGPARQDATGILPAFSSAPPDAGAHRG